MADVDQPTHNAAAERFMRTLKEEHIDFTKYVAFADAQQQLGQWLEVEYMTMRMHSALAYATPAEFEAAFWKGAMQATPQGSRLVCSFWGALQRI